MHSIEPLLVSDVEVQAVANEVLEQSIQAGNALHHETLKAVANLLRTVNCYYSNLIEGHNTRPVDIEKAMRSEYAADTRQRDLQLEARAHIEVQLEIEERIASEPDVDIISEEFLCWIHREFYKRLSGSFRSVTNPDTGKAVAVVPGEIRQFDVYVGRHVPPSFTEIPAYLKRLNEVYKFHHLKGSNALSAIAAAHHRVLWVHPFGDGNGRVVRLMTDALLAKLCTGSYGLWTASRGLARMRDEYLKLLENADSPRLNDYDGRGALSLKALIEFSKFFLTACLDQIVYMKKMLEIDSFADRIKKYGQMRQNGLLPDRNGNTGPESLFRKEMTFLLHQLVYRGSIPRGEIPSLLGLEERTARRVVRQCTDEGFIVSKSSRAPLCIAIPAHAAPEIFPGLFK
ncbi:MAG TPA: Fic family protein [Chitinispirillaceae bacterium]|nr:Fic family protein [Chitinispirillaceae bacterium]